MKARLVLGASRFDCLQWAGGHPFDGASFDVWDLYSLKQIMIPNGVEIQRTQAYHSRPDKDEFEELLPQIGSPVIVFMCVDDIYVACSSAVVRFMYNDDQYMIVATLITESGYVIDLTAKWMETMADMIFLHDTKTIGAQPT